MFAIGWKIGVTAVKMCVTVRKTVVTGVRIAPTAWKIASTRAIRAACGTGSRIGSTAVKMSLTARRTVVTGVKMYEIGGRIAETAEGNGRG